VSGLPDSGKAFYKTKVTARTKRSVQVRMPDGTNSELISTKFVQHKVGVAILQFGDFVSEATLLDPLAKTVLQYCRLLFGDDNYVRMFKVRSLAELTLLCAQSSFHPFEHIVVIGHGTKAGALHAGVGDISVAEAVEAFGQHEPAPWNFTFLCCYLGRKGFAETFSASACCSAMVAPFNSVHGAVSAQFSQTYLIKALLEGETTTVAHRHASVSTPPKSAFRLWRNGHRVKAATDQAEPEAA
jgi:hypothetical protein